jgi:invasion protein IalB
MGTRQNINASIGLAAAFLLIGAAVAPAQDASTGPLFSTPASRSTVGSPILSDPSAQKGGDVIGNSGKGKAAAPARNDKQQAQGSAQPAEQSAKTKDWQLQCVEINKGQKRCQIAGSTLSADGKQVILVMALAPAADGKATATQIAVPLGISLKAGIRIDVSGAYNTMMTSSRCTSQGCLAEGNVEPALIDAMKTRPAATVTVATPDGKAIPIKLSLDGFADAFAAMQSAEQGAKETSKAK